MKRISYLLIAALVVLSACTGGFKKGLGGVEYKIIESGNGKKIPYGSYVEFGYKYQLKDTVFGSSDDMGRQIFVMDSTKIPPLYFDIFKRANIGDSIVLKMVSDSFFREQMPPFAKKGEIVYSRFKVLNAYADAKQADSANEVNMKFAQAKQMEMMQKKMRQDSIEAIPQLAKDIKTIEDYLASKSIKAQKGKLGTFVEVLSPGDGNILDTGKVIKVNYTGRTFAGTVFDSNTDTAFKHVEPYAVEIPSDINAARVVHGWIDGLKLLSKGAKARFYIPSPLGYGKNGNGEKIKPNDNLIFDIEVVDVISRQQAYDEAMAQQKKQQEAMMKMQQQQAKQNNQNGNPNQVKPQ